MENHNRLNIVRDTRVTSEQMGRMVHAQALPRERGKDMSVSRMNVKFPAMSLKCYRSTARDLWAKVFFFF